MKNKEVWIIKDVNGNFISHREMEGDKYYIAYSGIADGFSFYNINRKDTAEQKLYQLINKYGDIFFIDKINLNIIPKGKRIDIEKDKLVSV